MVMPKIEDRAPGVRGAERQMFKYDYNGGRLTIEASSKKEADEAFARLRKLQQREAERRSRWPQDARGHIDTRAAMTALARRLPGLRNADGVEPWDADRFLRWLLVVGAYSHGENLAGRFMLSVWNTSTNWEELANEDEELLATYRRQVEDPEARIRLPRFDLFEAMGTWDEEHRAAMLYWLEAPFYP
jgi:hypothetical protein